MGFRYRILFGLGGGGFLIKHSGVSDGGADL